MFDSVTSQFEQKLADRFQRPGAVALGRAARGLKLLLRLWRREGRRNRIALPTFLCQSPLAAVVSAGWEPVFCDVDLNTGNVPMAEWLRVLELGVDAVLTVHLFGMPQDCERLALLCRERGVYLIEDAAQALGAAISGRHCGEFGDAALLSFGHTKQLDVGGGGMLLLNDAGLAKEIRKLDAETVAGDVNHDVIAALFRDQFYAAKAVLPSNPKLAKRQFRGLLDRYFPLLDVVWRPEIAGKVGACLSNVESGAAIRRMKFDRYVDEFGGTSLVPLHVGHGANPWRATFRLPHLDWAKQDVLCNAMRAKGVDVSNWYLPSHWLLGDELSGDQACVLPRSEELSQQIFQFWLDDLTSFERISEITALVRGILKEFDYA